MPYINEIVSIINNTLAAGKLSDDKRFVRQLHGLSETLPRNYNNSQDGIPTLVDVNGGTMFSGFNDAYSIVIYHRCLSTNIVEAPVQFGDGNNAAREEASMRMIVWADRLKTKLQPQQLSFLLTSAVQQQLMYTQISSYPGLYGVTIEADRTNYDGVAIWQQEYKLPAATYPVHPTHIYLALDYTIVTDYDVTCISDCPTC
jgi:hypothetical protein